MRPVHAWLVLFALGLPGSVYGALPFPINSIVPSCISLVGSDGATAARAFGSFTVIIRDLANDPVPGAAVTIALSDCRDLHLCADQLDPDATVNCALGMVTKSTDALGTVHFTLLGGSNGAGHASTLLGGGRIYVDGVLIGTPTMSAFDLDGVIGVSINDLSVWLGDFGTSQPYGRCDYDCSGAIGISDLSLWLNAFGSNSQIVSCTANCP